MPFVPLFSQALASADTWVTRSSLSRPLNRPRLRCPLLLTSLRPTPSSLREASTPPPPVAPSCCTRPMAVGLLEDLCLGRLGLATRCTSSTLFSSGLTLLSLLFGGTSTAMSAPRSSARHSSCGPPIPRRPSPTPPRRRSTATTLGAARRLLASASVGVPPAMPASPLSSAGASPPSRPPSVTSRRRFSPTGRLDGSRSPRLVGTSLSPHPPPLPRQLGATFQPHLHAHALRLTSHPLRPRPPCRLLHPPTYPQQFSPLIARLLLRSRRPATPRHSLLWHMMLSTSLPPGTPIC